jgi:hypothetical protein
METVEVLTRFTINVIWKIIICKEGSEREGPAEE